MSTGPGRWRHHVPFQSVGLQLWSYFLVHIKCHNIIVLKVKLQRVAHVYSTFFFHLVYFIFLTVPSSADSATNNSSLVLTQIPLGDRKLQFSMYRKNRPS